jgi:hypothetical protein
MIKNFKQFLGKKLLETRRREIERDIAYEKFEKFSLPGVFYRPGGVKTLIWRGVDSDENYFEIDTRDSFRENLTSSTAAKMIKMWIDTHPDWKKFPKRSYSLIASTNKEYSRGFSYGDSVFAIFSDINEVWGVCPDIDIFYSFKNNFASNFKKSFVDEFFRSVSLDIKSKYFELRGGSIEINDYKDIVEAIYKIWTALKTEDWQEIKPVKNILQSDSPKLYQLFLEEPDKDKLEKVLEVVLNPWTNGFKLMTYGQILADGSLKNREVWSSGEFIGVNAEVFDDFLFDG